MVLFPRVGKIFQITKVKHLQFRYYHPYCADKLRFMTVGAMTTNQKGS